MTTLKIWFTDFWYGFNPHQNQFIALFEKIAKIEIDESKPDLLICSVFGRDWMQFSCKKLWYTYERIRPFPELFDYSMSFEPSSERNLYLPMIRIWSGYLDLFKERDIGLSEWKARSTINFVYSNADAAFRNKLFHRLHSDHGVHSGGGAFNNVGGKVADKHAFLATTNITIACENVRWPGYVTEKILEARNAGTVPVYAGDTNWRTWLNPKAALISENDTDFGSISSAAGTLLHDFDAYRAMYREPLFIGNVEPVGWNEEVIVSFLDRVISDRAPAQSPQKTRADYLWLMKDEWFRWRIVPWSHRYMIHIWKFLFPLKYLTIKLKDILREIKNYNFRRAVDHQSGFQRLTNKNLFYYIGAGFLRFQSALFKHLCTMTGFRPSSAPFLSGDTFRELADFIWDENKSLRFSGEDIKPGSIVFVSSWNVQVFLRDVASRATGKFVLISANGDVNITADIVRSMPETVGVWFAQNLDFEDTRIHALPIGLENRHLHWHGIVKDFRRLRKSLPTQRWNRILYGFAVSNNPRERTPLIDIMRRMNLALTTEPIYTRRYRQILSQFGFVASPPGNGLDCHRTWEALYLRVVPVVKKSVMTQAFKAQGIPLYEVSDWGDLLTLSESTLASIYAEYSKSFDTPTLWADYWVREILDARKTLLGGEA